MGRLLSFWLLCCISALAWANPADIYLDLEPRVIDIGHQEYQGSRAAVITVNVPLARDRDLGSFLAIMTARGKPDGDWILSDSGKSLYFPLLEPDTSYQVHALKGLPFVNGRALAADKSANFKTPDMPPLLAFASKGNLLADRLTEGLPVVATNVDQADVDFYRLKEGSLTDFIRRFGRKAQLSLWESERALKMAELVYSGRFALELPANTRATRYLPLDDIAPLKEGGIYLALLRRPGVPSYNSPMAWFSISDLGLHLRQYQDRIEAYVASLASARALQDVELSLLDNNGKTLASARSDHQGRASFTAGWQGNNPPQLLLARQGNQASLVKLFGPALDLSDFALGQRRHQDQELFIYGPRDLYRPGEELIVSALLRDGDGKAVPGIPLQFQLLRPDGRKVAEQRLAASELGYYQGRFPLGADAATGSWQIRVRLPDGSQQSWPFKVEEFLPERLALTLAGPKTLAPGEPLALAVQGDYLYGAPAGGNKLQSRLFIQPLRHPFEAFKDFYFGDVTDKQLSQRHELDEVRLDEQGRAEIMPEPHWQDLKSPVSISLFESLLESGGRAVSRQHVSQFLPATQLVGIKPLFEDDRSPHDSLAGFELVVTDGSQPLAAGDLEVRLIWNRHDYHWFWSDSEGWRSDYSIKSLPVFEQSLAVARGEVAKLQVPVEWGSYRLEVRNPATGLISSYDFHAGWKRQDSLATKPDQISIDLDQAAYGPGDQAQLLIKAPRAGRGFLVVEGDRPLYWRPIQVDEQGTPVILPMDPAWARHDLYVSVVLVQPGTDREDGKLPRRMVGIRHLPLDREARRLKVAILAPDKSLPERELVTRVQVDGAQGQVHLTLAAVDLGVLNITRFQTPDPFGHFFGQRRHGVDLRDSFADLIEGEDGALARLRFGGDSAAAGGLQPPSQVQIVSLFSGEVNLDATGQAEIPLQLPDFNGRLRLMAAAFSADAFGSAEQEVTVAAPLVTQLAKPRFLANGDHSQLTLDLHNLSGQPQQLSLQLELGSGLTFDQGEHKLTRALRLDDQQKQTLVLPVQAQDSFGEVPIRLILDGIQVDGEDMTLSRDWALGVRPAWPATPSQFSQLLAPGARFQLPRDAMSELLPATLRGSLAVSPLPALDVASQVRALKAYPYGCLEQTTSGVFGQLYLDDDKLAALNLKGSTEIARREAIQIAISRLMGMQKGSGGFGLWGDRSREEYWLTPYVADFLVRARELGHPVPEDNLKRALDRLREYLLGQVSISPYYGGHQSQRRFAAKAYAAQVLARLNQAPLGSLRTLFDHHRQEATPLALLQLGLALSDMGDHQRGDQAVAQALAGLARPNFDTSDYGSHERDLALALFWLTERGGNSQWRPLLVRLYQDLGHRNWYSTQERNALVLAALAVQGRQDDGAEPLDFALAWQDKQQSYRQRHASLPVVPAMAGLTLTNQGQQELYFDLRLSGYGRKARPVIDEGLAVRRRYFDETGKAISLDRLKPGQLLLVELRISAEQDTPHALVVDLLPAGLELENQNLEDALSLDKVRIDGKALRPSTRAIRHQEYRDDRYVAAIDQRRHRSTVLYYLARAVTPGRYLVPPTFVEDMYRPWLRYQGDDAATLTVESP
ncbi:alpha-2-macroglobulin [Gallaecimonas sp. GXIMD4217]|uniref:alpha-2-macroglobulin family protein n=1 Tax=Gallaecimonas sp. GXIMD4217 TaxID=3131927 RepID=UPI00311AF451